MKKISLVFLLVTLMIGSQAQAQSTKGGLPWSLEAEKQGFFEYDKIPLIQVAAPDYEKARVEDVRNPGNGSYRFGLATETNMNIENSGAFTFLQDGRTIWTLKISMEGALAMDLYYDRFHLPEGFQLYLMNENRQQIVGAIDKDYNPEDGLYSTASVQGNITIIELDMEAGVDPSTVAFHINKVLAHYRGGMAEILEAAYGKDRIVNAQAKPTDEADPCHINAVCEPEGTTYANLKQTAVHSQFLIQNAGYSCSGNLINNTSQDCTPLYLTASHCDFSNSTADQPVFSTAKFYFNYEYPECTGNVTGSAPMTDLRTGAKFLARSDYNNNSNSMIGDFLLLQIKDPLNDIGDDYGGYLAGWDRTAAPPLGKAIGFHHPAGDPKKLTVFDDVAGNGNFNGGAANSHWSCKIEKGGIEGGSSGSGIFTMATGRLIGDLSGGPDGPAACDTGENNRQVYSKLYLNWEYTNGGDGTAQHRLKDWLDPTGTNLTAIETIKKAADGDSCGTVSIRDVEELGNAINVYPNPTAGILRMKVNLSDATELTIRVSNILGQQIGVFSSGKIQNGEVVLDLSVYANGVYLLSIESDKARTTKKVILQR